MSNWTISLGLRTRMDAPATSDRRCLSQMKKKDIHLGQQIKTGPNATADPQWNQKKTWKKKYGHSFYVTVQKDTHARTPHYFGQTFSFTRVHHFVCVFVSFLSHSICDVLVGTFSWRASLSIRCHFLMLPRWASVAGGQHTNKNILAFNISFCQRQWKIEIMSGTHLLLPRLSGNNFLSFGRGRRTSLTSDDNNKPKRKWVISMVMRCWRPFCVRQKTIHSARHASKLEIVNVNGLAVCRCSNPISLLLCWPHNSPLNQCWMSLSTHTHG